MAEIGYAGMERGEARLARADRVGGAGTRLTAVCELLPIRSGEPTSTYVTSREMGGRLLATYRLIADVNSTAR